MSSDQQALENRAVSAVQRKKKQQCVATKKWVSPTCIQLKTHIRLICGQGSIYSAVRPAAVRGAFDPSRLYAVGRLVLPATLQS